jgi:hypothetical protein
MGAYSNGANTFVTARARLRKKQPHAVDNGTSTRLLSGTSCRAPFGDS